VWHHGTSAATVPVTTTCHSRTGRGPPRETTHVRFGMLAPGRLPASHAEGSLSASMCGALGTGVIDGRLQPSGRPKGHEKATTFLPHSRPPACARCATGALPPSSEKNKGAAAAQAIRGGRGGWPHGRCDSGEAQRVVGVAGRWSTPVATCFFSFRLLPTLPPHPCASCSPPMKQRVRRARARAW